MVGNAVLLGEGSGVNVAVAWGIAVSLIGRGVAVRITTTGSGNVVGVGLQAGSRKASSAGSSLCIIARILMSSIKYGRLTYFVYRAHAIIMCSRLAEDNDHDED